MGVAFIAPNRERALDPRPADFILATFNLTSIQPGTADLPSKMPVADQKVWQRSKLAKIITYAKGFSQSAGEAETRMGRLPARIRSLLSCHFVETLPKLISERSTPRLPPGSGRAFGKFRTGTGAPRAHVTSARIPIPCCFES
jgi:hypothetical protein